MIFKFPFKPYDIQNSFMKCMYDAIKEKKVCLIESPTGTGKSMSIICAVGRWLEDFKNIQRNETGSYLREIEVDDHQPNSPSKPVNLSKHPNVSTKKKPSWLKKQIVDINTKNDEQKITSVKTILNTLDSIGNLDNNHINSLNKPTKDIMGYRDKLKEHIPRIYYCSRTISQLDQFADEIKKSPFSNCFRITLYSSREKLCINEDIVGNISSSNVDTNNITQKCHSISTNCKDQSSMCKYYSRYLSNQNLIPNNLISTTEWKQWGYNQGICPYFANKFNLQMAEIILLPYSALLSSKIVEQLKLQLEKSVVIIDEGHNLLNAVQNVVDVCVGQNRFEFALKFCYQCHNYLKNISRQKSNDEYITIKDISMIESFIYVLKSFINRISKSPHLEEITSAELISSCHLENYNLSQIVAYFNTNMYRFIDLFNHQNKFQIKKHNWDPPIFKYRQCLFEIFNFMESLTNAKPDDFVIINWEKINQSNNNGTNFGRKSIKILHLNLDNFMKPLVEKCRSIVIVGGTLHPNDEIINLLEKSGIPKDNIIQQSYGHVVDNKQLFPAVLSKGIMGSDFNFRYETRNTDNQMMKDLGLTIIELSQSIPDGIVCFFPSFNFLQKTITLWRTENIYNRLNTIKPIFYESIDGNGEHIYEEYKKNITLNKEGIFFAIMNGKGCHLCLFEYQQSIYDWIIYVEKLVYKLH